MADRCKKPGPDCKTKRVWSRKASRFFWFCECGRAFADADGQQIAAPLRSDPDPTIECPTCKSPMVRVTGAANGDFYSCSRWPRCQATREIDSEPEDK